jgi:hypothetical protein
MANDHAPGSALSSRHSPRIRAPWWGSWHAHLNLFIRKQSVHLSVDLWGFNKCVYPDPNVVSAVLMDKNNSPVKSPLEK